MSSGNSVTGECLACAGRQLEELLRIEQTPVLLGALWETAPEAVAAPSGDLDLVLCRDCGLVFNASFDPALVDYDGDYDNSLHFSPLFQSYAEDLADRLARDHDLRGKRVVEIGSGKGDFL